MKEKMVRLTYLACEGRWPFIDILLRISRSALWQICGFFPNCFPLRHVAGFGHQILSNSIERYCTRIYVRGHDVRQSCPLRSAGGGERHGYRLSGRSRPQEDRLTFRTLYLDHVGEVPYLLNFYSVAPHLRRSSFFGWGGFMSVVALFELERQNSCCIKCGRSFLSLPPRIACISLLFFSFLPKFERRILSLPLYIMPLFFFFFIFFLCIYYCFQSFGSSSESFLL